MIHEFQAPTRLVHGVEARQQAGRIAGNLGIKSAFVIVDEVVEKLEITRAIGEALHGSGIHTVFIAVSSADALLTQVDEIAARAPVNQSGFGIVGIGGGSALCAAKAVAMSVPNGRRFSDIAFPNALTNAALPLVMVPTTAGSGAEVSQFTVVKDEAGDRKLVGGGPMAFPDVAILDPSTTATLPHRSAVFAVVDAMAHAIEGFYSRHSTALTDALAMSAIQTIIARSEAALYGNDAQARADLLLASSMANMACGNAGLGLAHVLALPLEVRAKLPHGLVVGALMPFVLEFNENAAPHKAGFLVSALGGDDSAAALRNFYRRIHFAQYVEPLPLKIPSWVQLAHMAVGGLRGVANGPITLESEIQSPDPRTATVSDAIAIYSATFSAIQNENVA